MSVYRVEQGYPDNSWLVVTTASDGIVDVVTEHSTRQEAQEAADAANRDHATTEADERYYRAQYDRACGYDD